MITLKNITLKNFLSIGQVTQAVNFESKDLTLILGQNLDLGGEVSRNGTGKTTLIQGLSYALFGSPINNIRKDNLINRTNGKGMLVTLEFSVNGIEYKIERGRKPNLLKFYVNANLQEAKNDAQGENKETQEQIEKALNMSADMFKNIVALNTYSEPFLAMKASDQRMIIEQLLGITLLSEKAEKLKAQQKETKDAIQTEEFRIKATEDANKRITEQLDNLKKRSRLWDLKQAENLETLTDELAILQKINIEAELAGHKELVAYNQRKKDHADLDRTIVRTESDIAREQATINKLTRELKTLADHKCHACGQDLHDSKHENITAEKQKQLDDATSAKTEFVKLLSELKEAKELVGPIGKMPKLYYDTEDKAVTHRVTVENLEVQIAKKRQDRNPYTDQIAEMETQALQTISFDKLNELNRKLDHQKFLIDLLTNKDSFVRKKIIDQNLSYLNTRLTHYLDKIGLPHQVVFQNDLSVEITEFGRELDFYNLSRGEMNRLILSLSWAFRDVWESLYSPINVMFIDELLDSGLDTIGVENSMGVLKEMSRARNKSIWLVSHREELTHRVSSVLRVIKEGGFTSYSTSNEVE